MVRSTEGKKKSTGSFIQRLIILQYSQNATVVTNAQIWNNKVKVLRTDQVFILWKTKDVQVIKK